MSERRLTDDQFRAFLNLMMVSDPWPLGDVEHALLEQLADSESEKRGFENWYVAYHEFLMPKEPEPPKEPFRGWKAVTDEVESEAVIAEEKGEHERAAEIRRVNGELIALTKKHGWWDEDVPVDEFEAGPDCTDGDETCERCGGTGKVDAGGFHTTQDCPTCEGHGSDFGHVDDGAPNPPVCPVCEGTGQILDVRAGAGVDLRHSPCTRCNGTGKVAAEAMPDVYEQGDPGDK